MESGDFQKEPEERWFKVTRIWYIKAKTPFHACKKTQKFKTVNRADYEVVSEEIVQHEAGIPRR